MSQTLHQIYQSKAIVLARTMVIKFHTIAEKINQTLIDQGYEVDLENPSTWKYYMNMFGEYHQADHDRLLALSDGKTQYIQIKVAGETQPMDADFNKELLYGDDADLAVANEYRFNTHYYNTLITKYPDFEDLILGVLNPVSPDISITANEGEILYCGGYLKTLLSRGYYHYVRQDYGPISENFLIESNEENLIAILQEYIYGFLNRWWNVNYAVTDNLFHAYFYGLMMLTIPQMLGNIRLGNAKTPMAHSFHIREHLESWGNLGWVSEYLSKGVLLWIYRNMVWMDANRGKAKVFDAIIENVLTPSAIPISGYRLRHDVSELDETTLEPDVYMEEIPLNHTSSSITTRREIIDIINAEVSMATENYYDPEGQAEAVADKSRYSLFDNLNTKVLESAVIDLSNHMAITKEDIGLNLWCYTASRGLYRGTVIFTNPLTNERIQLTPLNAYILSVYCFNKGWANLELEEIPTIYPSLILRHQTDTPGVDFPVQPKLEDLRKGVIRRFVTDAQLKDILGNFTPDFTHSSSVSFAAEVERAHAEAMRKYYSYCRIEDAQGRGFGEWAAHQCYWYDIPCPLTTAPTKYSDWLTIHGIEFDSFKREDYITLALEIVEAATGVNLNASDDLRNKQTAALSVLKHFSSYTIQLIQDTIASDSYWLDWKTLRITNDYATAKNEIRAQLPRYTVTERWGIKEGPIWLQAYNNDNVPEIKESSKEEVNVDIGLIVHGTGQRSAERAALPSYTVVSAIIPDIIVETRTKVYSTLTSTIYPVNFKERIDASDSIHNTIDIDPANTPLNERVNSTIALSSSLVVSLPVEMVVENYGATFTLGGIIELGAPAQLVTETIAPQLSMGEIELAAPSTTMVETISGSLTIGDIVIAPQVEHVVETIESTVTLSSIELAEPSQGTAEVVNANISIGNTIEISQTNDFTVTQPANLTGTVTRIELFDPTATSLGELSSEETTTTATVSRVEIYLPESTSSEDATSTTAMVSRIEIIPSPSLEVTESTNVTSTVTRIEVIPTPNHDVDESANVVASVSRIEVIRVPPTPSEEESTTLSSTVTKIEIIEGN